MRLKILFLQLFGGCVPQKNIRSPHQPARYVAMRISRNKKATVYPFFLRRIIQHNEKRVKTRKKNNIEKTDKGLHINDLFFLKRLIMPVRKGVIMKYFIIFATHCWCNLREIDNKNCVEMSALQGVRWPDMWFWKQTAYFELFAKKVQKGEKQQGERRVRLTLLFLIKKRMNLV